LGGVYSDAEDEVGDGELLERFLKQKDEAAFGELVNRHGAMVLGVCRRILDHEEDIEDAFQASFMVLVCKAESIRQRTSVASWLFGVALRVARRARAALRRRREHERRAATRRLEQAPPQEAWEDLKPVLDAALDRLPEKYRAPVILCYLEGKTYQEAAELLGLALGTVSSRLTHARTLLARHLRRRRVVLPLGLLAILLDQNAAPAAMPPALPPRALEAARSAAGAGDTVSPRVASLAQGVLRAWSNTYLYRAAATLAAIFLIALVGFILWHRLISSRPKPSDTGPTQAWQERYTLTGHGMLAWGLAFTPDGNTLASQGGAPSPHLWDAATGQHRTMLNSENAFHALMGFTADSREAITSGTGAVRVWDVATGKMVAKMAGGRATHLAPDRNTVASVGSDGAVHLIDVGGRRQRIVEEKLDAPANAVIFSPDSALLAVGADDGSIRLYDVATRQPRGCLPGHILPVHRLSFSADGSLLAVLYHRVANRDPQAKREVKLWDVASGKGWILPTKVAVGICFAPVGELLATNEPGGPISLWDPATGECRQRFPGSSTGGASMLRIVFSPDGKTIVVPGDAGTAQLRDTQTGKILTVLEGHTRGVIDAAFSADGRFLATGTIAQLPGEQPQQPPPNAEVKVWERTR
jgi:RNA polymerase sigma factor (sigma-70 family)